MTDTEPRPGPRPGDRPDDSGRSPVDGRTDADLLRAAQLGDSGAYGEFYLRYGAQLLGYFRPRCANTQDAYDLVSETFAQGFRSIEGFDPERGAAVGWLYGIARNMYRHYARRGAVETRGRERLRLMATPLSRDDIDLLERTIDLEALHTRVAPAIAALPSTLREAVQLRCVDGCDYDQIAEHLGVRPATARKRVSRGLTRLGEELGENPFTNHD